MATATALAVTLLAAGALAIAATTDFDVLVYGATSGGVAAAVAASRHDGVRVGLLVANGGGCGPSTAGANHIGGMSSGGLSKTDIGSAADKHLVGGIAGEFYAMTARHYNTTAPPHWNHEPHVARAAFDRMLANSTVTLLWGGHGANVAGVEKSSGEKISGEKSSGEKGSGEKGSGGGKRILSLRTADGRSFSARSFVDASYEGDLLAAAGGSWVVGRESRARYNESAAGRRPDDFRNNGYEFRVRVDPFDAATGDPLPLLDPADQPVGVPGQGDGRVQAYNFRLCATSDPRPGKRVPFPPPDPSSRFARDNATWELARRYFADPNWRHAERRGVLTFVVESPPLDGKRYKRDWNNPFLSPLNTDCVTGCNQSGYPIATTLAERLRIWEDHKQYYLSLLSFYLHDPAVPADVRATLGNWGLCGDEFNGTEHWPPQLYARETRRMVGDRVFTQNSPRESLGGVGNSSIGCGDYTFDSHPAQRFACRNGTDPRCEGARPPWLKPGEVETRPFAWSEGNVQQSTEPYPIPLWTITPKRDELSNLLVIATPSASHIGFSSLRLEPQFMIIGHSAGTAAAIFSVNGTEDKCMQDIDLDVLTAALLREGQVLHPPADVSQRDAFE